MNLFVLDFIWGLRHKTFNHARQSPRHTACVSTAGSPPVLPNVLSIAINANSADCVQIILKAVLDEKVRG